MNVLSLLTGGFAKGYRSYILSAITVLTAAAGWAVGDLNGMQAATAVTAALGVTTAALH